MTGQRQAETQRTPGSRLSATPPPLSLVADDQSFRVEFSWSQDRYRHRFVESASGKLLAESVEGDPLQPWPPSPPIQQLSAETIDGRLVLLGVGSAGRSHWSLSVESIEQEGVVAFRFDVACRCPTKADVLGSCYQGSYGVRVVASEGECRVHRPGNWVITPTDQPPTHRWTYVVRRSEVEY